MLLIAVLMMSTVRYPSGKKLDLQTQTKLFPFIWILLVAFLVYQFKEVALLIVCLSYIFFGLIRQIRRPRPMKMDANDPTAPEKNV